MASTIVRVGRVEVAGTPDGEAIGFGAFDRTRVHIIHERRTFMRNILMITPPRRAPALRAAWHAEGGKENERLYRSPLSPMDHTETIGISHDSAVLASHFMSTAQMLALFLIVRDKLTRAIEALQGTTTPPEKTPGPGRKAVPTVCRTGLEAGVVGRSYRTCETRAERGRQTGDSCGDKEALGGDQGGDGCCGSTCSS